MSSLKTDIERYIIVLGGLRRNMGFLAEGRVCVQNNLSQTADDNVEHDDRECCHIAKTVLTILILPKLYIEFFFKYHNIVWVQIGIYLLHYYIYYTLSGTGITIIFVWGGGGSKQAYFSQGSQNSLHIIYGGLYSLVELEKN